MWLEFVKMDGMRVYQAQTKLMFKIQREKATNKMYRIHFVVNKEKLDVCRISYFVLCVLKIFFLVV